MQLDRGNGPQDLLVSLPTVTKTEAWSRRVLNTQLGSWAQADAHGKGTASRTARQRVV